MKRFAAHYLFVPGSGFLKQYAIEIEGGYICHIFPFYILSITFNVSNNISSKFLLTLCIIFIVFFLFNI